MITVIYIWNIKRSPLSVLRALRHMAADRRELKSDPAIAFFKLLGTGSGQTFTPKDATAYTWALLVTIKEDEVARFDQSENITAWRAIAENEVRLTALPIAVHGAWSGSNPFDERAGLSQIDASRWDGKILAITRAKIAWRKNLAFWKAVPPVTMSLRSNPGLEYAIGIGEAPIGLQGTFSIWDNAKSLRNFAYQSQAHADVIAATARENWYEEELFSRFALLEQRGTFWIEQHGTFRVAQ
jgi:hypothetical protein